MSLVDGGTSVKMLLKIQGSFFGGLLANDCCSGHLYILFLILKFAHGAQWSDY